jgi:hypothetical protein
VRKITAAVVVAAALATAPAAIASYGYVWPAQGWWYGKDASSVYSGAWKRNWFQKMGPGYDTSVTFIDNVSYSWHNTVRNRYQTTANEWFSSAVKKGYARSYSAGYIGTCVVFDS